MIFSLCLLACSSAPPQPKSCDAMQAGISRDECYHAEIMNLPGSASQQALEKAKLIDDMMIRGSAVSSWIRDHNNEVNKKNGMALCELLDGRDRSYCMRRLSSPHLKR